MPGGLLDPLDERCRSDGEIGRNGCGHLAMELRRSPRRLPLDDRFHRTVQHVRRLLTGEAAPSVDAIDGIVYDKIRFESEPSGLFRPAGMQYLGVDRVRLVGAVVDDGLPLQPPPLAGRRLTAHRVDEAIELVVHAPPDVGGASRELGEQVGADVAHLGDASFGRMPSDPEARRHLGAQAGVIKGGECLLVVLDQPGVECQPAAVRRLDPIGDHEVGVDLRVERPAGVLSKRGRHDSLGVDHRHFPTDPVPGVRVPFDPAGERSDCSIVCGEHFPADVMVTEGEHHGHGLRRRTCHVEPTHRRVVVRAAERTIGTLWIHPRHEGEELFVRDLTGQAEQASAVADPDTAWLARVEVVVRERLDVVGTGVGTLERGHSHGHGRTPHTGWLPRPLPRASVHSSVLPGLTTAAIDERDMATYSANSR